VLLTVDIGTSTFKSAVWDFRGERLALGSRPLPAPAGGGESREGDSAHWLAAFGDCCRALGATIFMEGIDAIVVCGNGPTLVPVLGAAAFADGALSVPAAPARLWLDRRGTEAARRVSEAAGGFVDAAFLLPKALDIAINEPRLYERTRFFAGCPELLAYALTGEPRTVFPAEGLERWFWTEASLGRLGLDAGKFPPFIRPGEVFGGLSAQVAAGFGFRPGIPVVSGGSDFVAAILGSGATAPGLVCNRTGTSDGVNACTERRIEAAGLMCYGHPAKPFWNLSGTLSTTGKAVEWACGLLGLESYDEFFSLAARAPAGAGGLVFRPFLAGGRSGAPGSPERGEMKGLALSTGRGEAARSVLEGINLAIRGIIETMEEAGAPVTEIRVAGSFAGSDLMNRLKADITGRNVVAPEQKETELLGLAMIGVFALGRTASLSESAAAFARAEKTFHPNAETRGLYDDLFGEYREAVTPARKACSSARSDPPASFP